jgi:hypothetical protein
MQKEGEASAPSEEHEWKKSKTSNRLSRRPTAAYLEFCGIDCSTWWSNGVLLFFGTCGLTLWCLCIVALMSMKSAIHVYTVNNPDKKTFLGASSGDGCWDSGGFLHLNLVDYINARLALLGLGILPAAAWAAWRVLHWCEHNTYDYDMGNTGGMQTHKTKWHHNHEEKPDVDTIQFKFGSPSFQTVAGISIFNLLAVFALLIDITAMQQWSKCESAVDDLYKNTPAYFDPEMKLPNWSKLPALLLSTNLLALVMGMITCIFGCTHAVKSLDRQANELHGKGHRKGMNASIPMGQPVQNGAAQFSYNYAIPVTGTRMFSSQHQYQAVPIY